MTTRLKKIEAVDAGPGDPGTLPAPATGPRLVSVVFLCLPHVASLFGLVSALFCGLGPRPATSVARTGGREEAVSVAAT